MADETGTLSDSCHEVKAEEKKEIPYTSSFMSQTVNESTPSICSPSLTASVSNSGMMCHSRLSCNPFAIKTATPVQSLADSSDNKETRPLVAPPTLKLGSSSETSSCSPWMTPTHRIVLRPSPLAKHAEKLKFGVPFCGTPFMENSSDTSNTTDPTGPVGISTSSTKIVLRPSALTAQTEKLAHSTTEKGEESAVEKNGVADSTSLESNGKSSKPDLLITSLTSTSSETSILSSSASSADNSFGLFKKCGEENSSNGNSFVFGQNLYERALISEASEKPSPEGPSEAHNLTFEEAASNKEELEKIEEEHQESLKKSLCESAKEYESKQVKRKFEEVAVITGEEEESNVLQMNCKLFTFNKAKMNWQERGRGILRLNDRESEGVLHSRVVMRTQGSLRVVLNTKVWSAMTIEHPSQKTVRLTAIDPEGVKVYLVMAHPKDAEQLFSALDWRVTSLKSQEESANNNDNEKNSSYYEAFSSSSLLDISSNDSFSDSPKKRCRIDGSADSSNETNFDGLIDSADATSSC